MEFGMNAHMTKYSILYGFQSPNASLQGARTLGETKIGQYTSVTTYLKITTTHFVTVCQIE